MYCSGLAAAASPGRIVSRSSCIDAARWTAETSVVPLATEERAEEKTAILSLAYAIRFARSFSSARSTACAVAFSTCPPHAPAASAGAGRGLGRGGPGPGRHQALGVREAFLRFSPPRRGRRGAGQGSPQAGRRAREARGARGATLSTSCRARPEAGWTKAAARTRVSGIRPSARLRRGGGARARVEH
jgi:hypothetical protein